MLCIQASLFCLPLRVTPLLILKLAVPAVPAVVQRDYLERDQNDQQLYKYLA